LNIETLQTIEFNKIIDEIKQFALTDEAKALLDKLHPTSDYQRIYQQLNEISEAKNILNQSTSVPLLGVNGMAVLLDKLKKEVLLQPDELESIKHLLINTKKLKLFMMQHESLAPIISQYAYSMYELSDVKEEINRCIYNGRVDDKASSELSKVRKQIYIVEGRIKAKLDSMVKSKALKKYLQDGTVSVKNNRYVLQVKANYKHEVPGSVIDKSSTGSTLFVEPTIINRYQDELNQLKMDEENEIYQILYYLASLILEYEQEISITLETFIIYDTIFSKAKYSRSIDANPVKLNTKHYIHIVNGRHPLLGKEAIPLNFEIGSDYSALVITGPNTGGKTVALKTVALLTAMVQAGLHVPVDTNSEFAIYGDILADIGDGQSIEQSLSTFSSHIKKLIQIVNSANKYTLVVIDEIGSGTDPAEGEGLAIALLDKLYEKGSTILATSHYGKVKEHALMTDGFINGKMHFDIDSLKPTYQLTIGEAGESNAFIIALRLGLPPDILSSAHKVTYNEEKDYSRMQLPSDIKTISSGKKVKKPKKIKPTVLPTVSEKTGHDYKIGDKVSIQSLHKTGIVFESINPKDEVGVMIDNKKTYVHKRKLKLLIPADQLYPEGYDFDILFKSKEYRKNHKLLSRKYVKNFTATVKEEDL